MFSKLSQAYRAYQFLKSFDKSSTETSPGDIEALSRDALEKVQTAIQNKRNNKISLGGFNTTRARIVVSIENLARSTDKRVEELRRLQAKIEPYKTAWVFGSKVVSVHKEIDRAIEKLNEFRVKLDNLLIKINETFSTM